MIWLTIFALNTCPGLVFINIWQIHSKKKILSSPKKYIIITRLQFWTKDKRKIKGLSNECQKKKTKVMCTMSNTFHGIDLNYGRTALRLIRRHERCSQKLARYVNHLNFLLMWVTNHVFPRDLCIRSPIPAKGGQKVGKKVSLRLLRERIQLARRTKEMMRKMVTLQRRV